MDTKIIEKSNTMPIELDFIKCFLKIDSNNEDHLIEKLIRIAVFCIEEKTEKMLTQTRIECTHNNNKILLPYTPVNNVISVSRNGQPLELSDILQNDTYKLIHKHGEVAGIETKFSYTKDHKITIIYNAGFDVNTLPKNFQLAVLRIVSSIYNNREELADIENKIGNMLQRQMVYSLN